MGKTFNMVGGGSGTSQGDLPIGSTITVTSDEGAIITITRGSKSQSGVVPASGTISFTVNQSGRYTVTANKTGETEISDTVDVLADDTDYPINISFSKIYGISRDTTNSSPTWTRTDDAVGFTFSASVGTTAGSSSFDTCYPWSDIERETINGDVMVKIPKFWFKRYVESNIEYIKICDKAETGFALHPAFQHNGTTQDYIYVGAYKMTSGYHSVSGATPMSGATRASIRSGCSARGTGYSQLDITTYAAIQMLILVETATNDSQSAIGNGYTSGSSTINTGSCDSVANLTGRPSGIADRVDVVYRGIEGFWGNIAENIDGINTVGGNYWICNNQSNFADNTTTNYTQLSYHYLTNWSASFITAMGCDSNNSAIILPIAASGGSSSTYYPDVAYSSSDWGAMLHGFAYSYGVNAGLFGLQFNMVGAGPVFGARLMCVPS